MRTHFFAKRMLVAVCAAAVVGCSLLVGIGDEQCERDEDCVTADFVGRCVRNVCMSQAKVDAGPDDGSCQTDSQCSGSTPRCLRETCVSRAVGSAWICEDDGAPSEADTVRYSFKVVEFLSRKAPTNMRVSACRNNDVACADPVASFVDEEGEGFVEFELPTGFFGFFEINSDDALQSLLYVTKPIHKDKMNRDVPVLELTTVEVTAGLAGFDFDESKGLAILEALDCTGIPAGGVQFKASRESVDTFYIVDQVPSREAQVTVYDESADIADGGFINVAPGFVTFSAFLGVDGIPLGTFNAQIRASVITFIDMEF